MNECLKNLMKDECVNEEMNNIVKTGSMYHHLIRKLIGLLAETNNVQFLNGWPSLSKTPIQEIERRGNPQQGRWSNRCAITG